MRPSGFRESPHEDLVFRFQKEELDCVSGRLEGFQIPEKIGEEAPLADVDPKRHVLHIPLALEAQFGKFGQQRRRQIIDAEEPQILKAFDGVRFAGSGQAADNDQSQWLHEISLRWLRIEELDGSVFQSPHDVDALGQGIPEDHQPLRIAFEPAFRL
jgi:hypothetical protein